MSSQEDACAHCCLKKIVSGKQLGNAGLGSKAFGPIPALSCISNKSLWEGTIIAKLFSLNPEPTKN